MLRFPAAITRDWVAGEINVRAMSLAYTTLLSLVPLLVFSISILKGLGTHGDLRYLLHEFFRPLGEASNELTDTVMKFVINMRGDVLGSIGLAFLVYTVITTIQKVEASFNFVWRVQRPRNLARRFSEYLSVMIVGPVLLALTISLFASVEHTPFAIWLNDLPLLKVTLEVVAQIVPYVIVTIVFTTMYVLIPNTRVQVRAALLGGVTAGVIWALVGKVFTATILYSSQLVAVYTGFAIVLTTLIWVYLSWAILLIGAQLTFYVQFPQYLRHGHDAVELCGSAREQVGLSVMLLIGGDYVAGAHYWTGIALAAELDIPSSVLTPVLVCLERAGLIVATEKEQFVPGRDLAAIRLIHVIDAVRTGQSGRSNIIVRPVVCAAGVMSDVEAAIENRLGERSLKDLIDASVAA